MRCVQCATQVESRHRHTKSWPNVWVENVFKMLTKRSNEKKERNNNIHWGHFTAITSPLIQRRMPNQIKWTAIDSMCSGVRLFGCSVCMCVCANCVTIESAVQNVWFPIRHCTRRLSIDGIVWIGFGRSIEWIIWTDKSPKSMLLYWAMRVILLKRSATALYAKRHSSIALRYVPPFVR